MGRKLFDEKTARKIQGRNVGDIRNAADLLTRLSTLEEGAATYDNLEKLLRKAKKAIAHALAGVGQAKALNTPKSRPTRELKSIGEKPLPKDEARKGTPKEGFICALQLSKHTLMLAGVADGILHMEMREFVRSKKDWRRSGAEWLSELTIGYPVARALWLKWEGFPRETPLEHPLASDLKADLNIARTAHMSLYADTPGLPTYKELKQLSDRKLTKLGAGEAKELVAAIGIAENPKGLTPFDARKPHIPEWIAKAYEQAGKSIAPSQPAGGKGDGYEH